MEKRKKIVFNDVVLGVVGIIYFYLLPISLIILTLVYSVRLKSTSTIGL